MTRTIIFMSQLLLFIYQLSNQHKIWISELEREEKFSDYAKYEHALHLHNEKFLNMQRVNSQIIHRAKDLIQVGFQHSVLHIPLQHQVEVSSRLVCAGAPATLSFRLRELWQKFHHNLHFTFLCYIISKEFLSY